MRVSEMEWINSPKYINAVIALLKPNPHEEA